MVENTRDILAQIYARQLTTINQINFTFREIEIIACLIHTRGVKRIALLLNISPKTVETHIRNINLKINCNSQDCIINFIEKSGKIKIIREFYNNIIHPTEFPPNEEVLSFTADETQAEPQQNCHKSKAVETASIFKNLKNFAFWVSPKLSQNSYIFVCTAMLIVGLAIFIPYYLLYSPIKEELSVRSDLIVPTDAVLLHRSDLLVRIDKEFTNKPGIQSVALIGPGGAGKTTLARQYVGQQHGTTVWEINAETPGSLYASFENLGEALSKTEEDKRELAQIQEIRDENKRQDKLVQFVKNHLRVLPNWFLIFDNVEQFAEIRDYFPQDAKTWGQGKIILTTRDKNIESNSQINHAILIEELDPAQKLDLFTRILNHGMSQPLTEAQREEAKQFLESIPSFPLDVSTAAHYLKATHIPYEKYLENLEHYHQDFANVQEKLLKEVGPYVKTRYGIIILSLEHLIENNKDFADLLLFVSLLDSQNIPSNLLKLYKNDTVVDSFIHDLKKYSLIAYGPSDLEPTFSIHRSTQSIMLAYLRKAMNVETNKTAIKVISSILEQNLDEAIEQDNIKKMSSLYGHIVTFLNHRAFIPEEGQARLLSALGYLESYVFKNNIKAKENIEMSYLIAKKYYNETDLELGKILVYLGIVYRKLGEYEKGKECLQKGLAIYRNHFPEGDFKISWVLENLGSLYNYLGDGQKAKEILEQVLKNYETNVPQNKAVYVRTLMNLGVAYKTLGDYKKSAELLHHSLQTHKAYFSPNHPAMAWILGYLGDTYRGLGEYKKAKDLFEEGLSMQTKYYPDASPENNWFMYLLGKVHTELGEYKKARTFFETVLSYNENNYGKEHVETGHVLRWLAKTFALEGNLEMAENLSSRAFEILQKNNSPDQYIILENLAEAKLKKSEEEKNKGNIQLSQSLQNSAKDTLKKALDMVRVYFPEDSPYVEKIKSKLQSKKEL